MKQLKNNTLFKVFVILVLTLLLLIPAAMINNIVREREKTQEEAIREVSEKMGEAQTLTGPFLSIPYTRYVKETSSKDGSSRILEIKEYIHLMPEELRIEGELIPEKLNRGIYEIVVYKSDLEVKGSFAPVDLDALDLNGGKVHFDKAALVLGLNDLRGIEEQIALKWGDKTLLFNPGVMNQDLVESGIHVPLTVDDSTQSRTPFQFRLALRGSQQLYFTPVGKITDVFLNSPWPNPKFNGDFLPDERTVDPSGFKAHWNILHLNRNFPQAWKGNAFKPDASSFGTDLLLPVDNYQKSHRAIRYAILFIGFTFLVFFFMEVLNKLFIHPIQYLLVGVALVVFYTLLLSISEHMAFNLAFVLAALATLLLITAYVRAILGSNKLALFLTGILTILYTFIFVIIQLQDFALLIGSLGIFMVLALVMYFSRKIDWYNIKLGDEQAN